MFDGRHVVSTFNAVGLDFDTFGNSRFEMGSRSSASASLTSLHLRSARSPRDGSVFAAEQTTQQYAHGRWGVPLGVTGLITPEAPEVTSIGENTDVLAPASALQNVTERMRADGADAVIVLSHLASETARTVAEEVDGVDAIIGDHAASLLEGPDVINDTVLSFVGDEYEYLGELALGIDGSGVTDHEFVLHNVGESSAGTDPFVSLVRTTSRRNWNGTGRGHRRDHPAAGHRADGRPAASRTSVTSSPTPPVVDARHWAKTAAESGQTGSISKTQVRMIR